MESKKEVKVSLVIFIISLIVIAIMGLYIYKLTNKVSENATTVENQVENTTVNTAEDTLTKEKLMTMARETLDRYNTLSIYANSNVGALPELLVELELATTEEINMLCEGKDNPSEDIKSNILYEDFKAAMLNYFCEEYFNENYSQYTNIDGYVSFNNSATGFIPIEVDSMTLTKQEENYYTFVVTFKDLEIYDHYLAGEDLTEEDFLYQNIIVLELVDDRLVLHKATYISEE